MILSRYILKHISNNNIDIPSDAQFELPEKIIQFGTGVLLRGLPDYFVNKANQKGFFNGRIVVVKSTTQGDSSAFDKQDGLYTICVRGLEGGNTIEENIINSSISRVLSAQEDWSKILECAADPSMQVVISNTTEIGIQLVNEDIRRYPPISFPGKLLAFLYARFHAFAGSGDSGMIIIPTELIKNNGKVLESIVLELAHLNGLEGTFIEWLETKNQFCSSLVDRIVPGKPDIEELQKIEGSLGYKDELLIMSESYSLWAIEGNESIKKILTFALADDGVIIAENIDQYRELKLRILNGTHTLVCGSAFLCGFETVKEAMQDELFSSFISDIMFKEVLPSIPYDIDHDLATSFANKVLDRFRNEYINHLWLNITMQYSTKLKLRVVPLLIKHYSLSEIVPDLISFGFASYINFTKPVKFSKNKYYGLFNDIEYLINDDQANIFYVRWGTLSQEDLVESVLKDVNFWGHDLNSLPGFSNSVKQKLKLMSGHKMKEVLKMVSQNKELV